MKEREYRQSIINYSSICPNCYWDQIQNRDDNKIKYDK